MKEELIKQQGYNARRNSQAQNQNPYSRFSQHNNFLEWDWGWEVANAQILTPIDLEEESEESIELRSNYKDSVLCNLISSQTILK